MELTAEEKKYLMLYKGADDKLFKKGDAILLYYNHEGFCPVIPVDKLIDSGLLADEHEFLFPPFLDCTLNGNNVEVSFADKDIFDDSDLNFQNMLFAMRKDEFNKQFNIDKDNGILSEELKQYCGEMLEYLYIYARVNYRHYKELYDIEKEESKTM